MSESIRDAMLRVADRLAHQGEMSMKGRDNSDAWYQRGLIYNTIAHILRDSFPAPVEGEKQETNWRIYCTCLNGAVFPGCPIHGADPAPPSGEGDLIEQLETLRTKLARCIRDGLNGDAIEIAVLLANKAAARLRALEQPVKTLHVCSICGLPITNKDGIFRGTGDGSMKDGGSFAHNDCYWRREAESAERRVSSLEQDIARARGALEIVIGVVDALENDGIGSRVKEANMAEARAVLSSLKESQ